MNAVEERISELSQPCMSIEIANRDKLALAAMLRLCMGQRDDEIAGYVPERMSEADAYELSQDYDAALLAAAKEVGE